MLNYNIAKARDAVQFLVDSPYYKHHVVKLRNTVPRPRAMPFKGNAEVLNELLVVGRQSLVALENLLAVVEFKRGGRESYMKSFMQAKRTRDYKLIHAEETTLGRKMTLEERVAYLRKQHAHWALQKTEHKARCAKEYRDQFGKEPTWAHNNAFIKDFWMHKDMELDVLLEQARHFAAGRKRPTVAIPVRHVTRAPRNPAMANKLSLAIENLNKK